MMTPLSIDIVMLAYREDNIGHNLRAWLPHARKIFVVIGATSEVAHAGFPATDPVTEAAVRAVPDPEHQIVVITRDTFWRDKNEMQWTAVAEMKADLCWQVDADEFYLDADIERARSELAVEGWVFSGMPHRIFWKDLTRVLVAPSGDDGWFSPARIWRRREGEIFLHLPFGTIGRMDGSVFHVPRIPETYRMLTWGRCYHSSWCRPASRLAFKFAFHRARGDGPDPSWIRDVWEGDQIPAGGVHPSQAGITPQSYTGPLPPALIAATLE